MSRLWGQLKDLLARGRSAASGVPPALTAEQYFKSNRPGVWKAVESSNVAAVGYFADVTGRTGGVLGVKFKGGHIYLYAPAELSLYTNMIAATSRGRYVWEVLRKRFPNKGQYRRIA